MYALFRSRIFEGRWFACKLAVVFILGAVALHTPIYLNPGFAQAPAIPSFWDRNERFSKPDLTTLQRLKFLTTTDFPPFNFIDRRKRLTGFHVDLARAICVELDILNRCQIQALPWAELQPALDDKEGEAIIAGLSVSAKTREKLAFSRPFLKIPGRFVVRRDAGLEGDVYSALFRKVTGVVAGSSHEAYFGDQFSTRGAKVYPDREAALAALKNGDVSAVFSDALYLSFWLTSESSDNCCRFFDGAFYSAEHFGNGLTIGVGKDRPELVEAMNYALSRLDANGKFEELYLRYFPLGLY